MYFAIVVYRRRPGSNNIQKYGVNSEMNNKQKDLTFPRFVCPSVGLTAQDSRLLPLFKSCGITDFLLSAGQKYCSLIQSYSSGVNSDPVSMNIFTVCGLKLKCPSWCNSRILLHSSVAGFFFWEVLQVKQVVQKPKGWWSKLQLGEETHIASYECDWMLVQGLISCHQSAPWQLWLHMFLPPPVRDCGVNECGLQRKNALGILKSAIKIQGIITIIVIFK